MGHTNKRDRVATILVYLQDVEGGGETEFTGQSGGQKEGGGKEGERYGKIEG